MKRYRIKVNYCDIEPLFFPSPARHDRLHTDNVSGSDLESIFTDRQTNFRKDAGSIPTVKRFCNREDYFNIAPPIFSSLARHDKLLTGIASGSDF